MKDLGMTQRRHVGASCAVGALSFLFVAIGCDSGGGGDDGSGGATSASGGGVGDGGSSAGGFQNGASGGGESSGAAPGNGGSGGAASSGGAVGAAGGQGGAHMNDPMCPAEQPTHEAACFVNLVVVCSYEGTNCACVSGEWTARVTRARRVAGASVPRPRSRSGNVQEVIGKRAPAPRKAWFSWSMTGTMVA
jgi:hypothetical protein